MNAITALNAMRDETREEIRASVLGMLKEEGWTPPVPPKRRARRGELMEFLHTLPRSEDCIDWPFGCTRDGAGAVKFGGRYTSAHKVALILSAGRAPQDGARYFARHSCGNRLCVNPRHLTWRSQQENQRRKVGAGAANRGQCHYRAKLNVTEVLYIRSSPRSQKDLSELFGVSQATIADIKTGRSWGSLQPRKPFGGDHEC